MLKGFLFMNNYCLFNNLAAMGFKVLMTQGISVLVFAFVRNLVLLVVSIFAYFALHRQCLRGKQSPALSSLEQDSVPNPSSSTGTVPLKLTDRRFILA